MIGIDAEGKKVLGFWLSEVENSREWLKIIEENKRRGVEDILFNPLDGLQSFEDAINVVYPKINLQTCIVHLMRNASRYIPQKEWVTFSKNIKAVYKAVMMNLKALFTEIKSKWRKYGVL